MIAKDFALNILGKIAGATKVGALDDTNARKVVDNGYDSGKRTLTVNGPDSYTLDKDVVVYKLDDGEFVISSATKSNLNLKNVIVYDLDEDGVVDVILTNL